MWVSVSWTGGKRSDIDSDDLIESVPEPEAWECASASGFFSGDAFLSATAGKRSDIDFRDLIASLPELCRRQAIGIRLLFRIVVRKLVDMGKKFDAPILKSSRAKRG